MREPKLLKEQKKSVHEIYLGYGGKSTRGADLARRSAGVEDRVCHTGGNRIHVAEWRAMLPQELGCGSGM